MDSRCDSQSRIGDIDMRVKGKKFDFTVVTKRLPTGLKIEMDLVEHPGAVLVIPFLSQDRIVFLRQYRAAVGKYLWELPAGTLERKESIRQCAKRELMEETRFETGRLTSVGKIHPVPGYSTEVIHIFKAEELKKGKGGTGDADEVIRVQIFTRTHVRKIFREGRITDAKTICALALCGWI